MRHPLRGMVLAGLLCASGTLGAETSDARPREASLADSRGEPAKLSRFRGKPVILFYEDKDSVALNGALKKDLYERGKAKGLLTAAHVVAVANLRSFDFFPARPIALSYVRDEEKRAGVPILVDLEGRMSEAPWELPGKTSTVVVLDAEGRLKLQLSGRLQERDVKKLYALLSELLGVDLAEG